MKKLVIAALIVLGATSASFAAIRHHHRGFHGLYNYSPYVQRDINRGGPGPRVQAGSGTGIGAVR